MNYYQKWTLTTILIALLFILILMEKLDLDFNIEVLIVGPTLLLFGLFWVMLFHKNGFIIKNSAIHIAIFFFQIPLRTKKIKLSKWHSVSILTASKRMGDEDLVGTFVPDNLKNSNWSYSEKIFRLTLLNQNHTIKSTAICAKSESEAHSLLEFIIKNTNLKHEVYSPNFGKNSS